MALSRVDHQIMGPDPLLLDMMFYIIQARGLRTVLGGQKVAFTDKYREYTGVVQWYNEFHDFFLINHFPNKIFWFLILVN